jgi:tetratricopeptide (TPR) repeat protein
VLAFALQNSGSSVEAGRERELARQLAAQYEDAARAGDRQGLPRGLERVQLDPQGSGIMHASAIIGLSAQREQREQAVFHLERGRRLADRGQDVEALGELRRAVYLSPYEAQAHFLIGRILLREGRQREAVDALKISIWSADGAPAHAALAEAYLKGRDMKSARSEAERALTMDPTSADAKRVLSQIK